MAKHQLKTADGCTVEVALQAMTGVDGAFSLRINDEPEQQIEINGAGNGVGWLRSHGRVVPYFATRESSTIRVWMEGRIHTLELIDRTARRAGGAASSNVRPEVVAPMPGTVLKINVAAGDRFNANQPLIIMESMKMEMTLSVPQAGTIKDVLCRPGQLVEMGAVLARLTADSDN